MGFGELVLTAVVGGFGVAVGVFPVAGLTPEVAVFALFSVVKLDPVFGVLVTIGNPSFDWGETTDLIVVSEPIALMGVEVVSGMGDAFVDVWAIRFFPDTEMVSA